MKKLFSFIVPMAIGILLTAGVFLPQQAGAQSPEKMSYQAVIRDASDNLITDTEIGMQISILQGAESGTEVYAETQTPTTNSNGLVSIEIGEGTVEGGDFKAIDWSDGPYFIKTETDPDGGTNYTITGTSQLLSVPYALHARTTESVPTGNQIGEMQYWDGTDWVAVAAGKEGQVLNFIGGVPTWKTEVGDNFVINFTTGRIWMDRNLGASQVADSSTDADAYGDLYQWGRAADEHESRTSDTTYTLSDSDDPGHGDFILSPDDPYDWLSSQNDSLWQGVSGTNNPCPEGYRLPTEAEWDAERQSWSSNDAAGAFASPLKLPVAGYRKSSDGSLSNVGSNGYYWSSTVDGMRSWYLLFTGYNTNIYKSARATGVAVRCIKD